MDKKIFGFVLLLLLVGSLAFAGGKEEAPAPEPEKPTAAAAPAGRDGASDLRTDGDAQQVAGRAKRVTSGPGRSPARVEQPGHSHAATPGQETGRAAREKGVVIPMLDS